MVTLSTPIDLHFAAPFERVSTAASVSFHQSWRPTLESPLPVAAPAPPPELWGGLTAALDALPLPAGLVAGQGQVVYANSALQMLSGSAPGDAAGLRLEDAAHPSSAPGWRMRTRWTRLVASSGTVLDCLTLVIRVDEPSGLTAQMFVETRSTQAARPDPATMPAEAHRPAANPRSRLTSREQQVLERLLTGMSNKGVARDLGISPRTIEVHRGRVLRKLGIQSLAQAGALQLKL